MNTDFTEYEFTLHQIEISYKNLQINIKVIHTQKNALQIKDQMYT